MTSGMCGTKLLFQRGDSWQTSLGNLAADCARGLLSLGALYLTKGRREGRAPAAPESVYKEMHTGWTTGDAGRPAFPARMVLTVSFALSSGSVALLPPSPRRCSMRVPVGRCITARLDARTAGVGTTRLLRPRTAWPQRRGLGVRTPDHQPNRCDRTVSYARCAGTQRSPVPVLTHIAPALPRPPHPGPHFVTIAKRPSGRAGMEDVCHKSEIRKSDIFLTEGVDGFWVFCPTPLAPCQPDP